MVHNNRLPVIFLQVWVRNTETGCICWLLDNWFSITIWEKMEKAKIFANCIERHEWTQKVTIPGIGCRLCESKVGRIGGGVFRVEIIQSPRHLYETLWINLKALLNTAAAFCLFSLLCLLRFSNQNQNPVRKLLTTRSETHLSSLLHLFGRSCCSTPSSQKQVTAKVELLSLIDREI